MVRNSQHGSESMVVKAVSKFIASTKIAGYSKPLIYCTPIHCKPLLTVAISFPQIELNMYNVDCFCLTISDKQGRHGGLGFYPIIRSVTELFTLYMDVKLKPNR